MVMSLIPWRNKQVEGEVGSPLAVVRREMDRLFDSLLRETWGNAAWPWGDQGLMPAIDMAETDQEVVVRMELPGVDPAKVDVSISDRQLTVSGEKQESSEKKDRDYFHREIRYGSFRRSVLLPEGIDPDQVDAKYENGVLTLTIKRLPTATPKKITVKTS